AHSTDSWQWRPDPATGYSVRGAYQLLTSHVSVTMDDADNLIWHPQLILACLDVERLSQPITYLSPAVLLVLFGI
ncbi:heat shock protein, partial [Trifolium pratense]